jgi:hypothetical protein
MEKWVSDLNANPTLLIDEKFGKHGAHSKYDLSPDEMKKGVFEVSVYIYIYISMYVTLVLVLLLLFLLLFIIFFVFVCDCVCIA